MPLTVVASNATHKERTPAPVSITSAACGPVAVAHAGAAPVTAGKVTGIKAANTTNAAATGRRSTTVATVDTSSPTAF
jgi:hypothetical protein